MSRYKEKDPGRIKRFLTMIAIIILVMLITLLIYDMYRKIEVTPQQQSPSVSGNRTSYVSEAEQKDKQIADVLEEITNSVVGISKIKNNGSSIFFQNSTQELGLGTGVIVSENGYIVTNWHVAGDKYSNCYVTLKNGTSYNGNVVWSDKDLDLSIVKINMKSLPYIKIGDSDKVRLGESVYAIGNPIGFEFQRTVTYGIISAKDRTIKLEEEDKTSYMEDLLQTDATINPGNSGGPLIDVHGNMIGITTVKITSAEGIGFAIPINTIEPIIQSFIQNDKFEEAYIGIFGYDKEVVPYLDSKIELATGIYVAQITIDGPCYQSKLKTGDIITKIDDKELNKMTDLRRYIYTKKPGETVTLNVLRKNRTMEIPIILGNRS